MKSVGFFPAAADVLDWTSLLARASWYLWPWRDKIEAVRVWGPRLPAQMNAGALGLDPAIDAQFADLRPLFTVGSGGDDEAAVALREAPCDLLFIWRAPETEHERVDVRRITEACRARGGVVQIVDPYLEMNEGSLYLWGCLNALGDQASRIDECRAKFEALAARVSKPSVYIFGTGPSLASLSHYDCSDGDAIVCNSIVANDALLDKLNPIALVAGDPIFHAGCSQYAAAFRAKLREMLETRDIFFVTVMRDYVQQLAQLPAHLHHKVIALPFAEDDAPFHFDLRSSFHIAPEGNVLSLLLFPLAAALYQRIVVCGCDGRPLTENSYFWGHDRASQLASDKMANIQRVHPAFFERSYDDHYSGHVASIARIVNTLEEAGKRIEALTPSFIPALAARQRSDTVTLTPDAPPQKKVLLVSVNPDASNDYGHWIGYDRRLSEQARKRGADFVSLANIALPDDIAERDGFFRRAFRWETWGAGNQHIGLVDLPVLAEFEASLARQVRALRAEYPEHDRVFYMYTGSLPHAVAMYRIAREHPDTVFVINTFWTCVMNCLADAYVSRFAWFLRKAECQPNLRIFAITPQLKVIFRQETMVNLPLLPHPTPSMAAPREPAPRPHHRFRVLFPGGMTQEKGFKEIPRILECIREIPSFNDAELMVRATDTAGVLDRRREEVEPIAAYATIVNQVMSDTEFLDWLGSADVAVLPYRRDNWVYRNSALLVDLLYLGIPVVCARGTWLSDVIDSFGGGITVDGDDLTAYARAVETVRADHGGYVASAASAAKLYDAANSWDALVESVLSARHSGRPAPPHDLAADESAPTCWWIQEDEEEEQMQSASATPPATPTPPPATPTPPPAPQRNRPREFAAFAWRQLTRSPLVVAAWASAIICAILSASPLTAVDPIRLHLLTVAVLAGLGAVALIPFKFVLARSEALRHRLPGAPIIADIVDAVTSALTARGVVRRLVLGLLLLIIAAWGITYAARLAGFASQFMLDVAFWGGGSVFVLVAVMLFGLAIAARVAISVLTRNHRRILASAVADSAEMLQPQIERLGERLEQHHSALEEELAVLRSALEEKLAGLSSALEEKLAVLSERHFASDNRHKRVIAENARHAADAIEDTRAHLGERQAAIEQEVTALTTGVIAENARHAADAIEDARAHLGERVQKLEDQLVARADGLRINLDEARNEAIRRQAAIEQDVTALATGVDAIGASVDGLTESAQSISAAMDAMETMLSSLAAEIDRLSPSEDAFASVEQSLNAARDRMEEIARDGSRRSVEAEEQMLDLTRKVSQRSEDAVASVEQSLNAARDRMEEIARDGSRRSVEAEEQMIDLTRKVSQRTEEADQTARRVHVLDEKLAAVESNGFHVVQRFIPRDDLTALAKQLSEAFDLPLSAPMLGYIGHQVRQLEANSHGRIAAPMSDILVRIAALMSVKLSEASVLEIGTLFGIGALAMHTVCATRFERLKLTFLDPLSGYYGGNYGVALNDLWTGVPVTRETLEHNIRVAGVPPEDARILQFYSENPAAFAEAAQERYDVLIIDGDHSFDGVMRDFNDYAPLVRKNGLIIFDDYEVPEWSGVTEAVDAIMHEHGARLRRVILHGKTLVCRVRNDVAPATKARGILKMVESGAE